ncbi:MAG: VIT and VWA domain-containing protein [Acidobacteriota bacterium]|nr:VIT and VWA domain-containing protein [Blastocatellia bacterium]MDW8238476.1 VIT and VWA domain-containing protein [Acidobacteriota bacterium]
MSSGKQVLIFAILLIFAVSLCYGQAGVLLGRRGNLPTWENFLSLDEMTLDININNQFATVRLRQIFANPVGDVTEGRYVFALPASASISEFAVWDGQTRIPGVMLEKRQAQDLYESLRQQAIDPGLAQHETDDTAAAAFTVKVVPIPAYGYKRLEMAYTQTLPVDGLQSRFSFPLRPSEYGRQRARHVRINLTLRSQAPIMEFRQEGTQLALTMERQTANEVVARVEAEEIEFAEDFAFVYSLGVASSQLDVLTHRAPERVRPWEIRDPASAQAEPDGYFQAITTFNQARITAGQPVTPPPRSLVLMLDTSLSMQWEKLERAYEALEYFLQGLTPQDRFNLILFNDDVQRLSDKPLGADAASIERALTMVRQSYLSGGTNLLAALDAAMAAANQFDRRPVSLVMITDGFPTLGTTSARRIVQHVTQKQAGSVRLYIFAIGTDVNAVLLQELARQSRGHYESARPTDDIRFSLRQFWSKVGAEPITDLTLKSSEKDSLHSVYPDINRMAYDQTQFAFIGRYRRPRRNVDLTVEGQHGPGKVKLVRKVDLPEQQTANEHLPRLWARARVDALLREIELEGESAERIEEIIRLSRRFNFVTPYTAFLAAPRALLRPRVIRPGDPVLRVRTDPSIRSVVAVFPFGLVKTLTYLPDEDVWQTRFLAPTTMDDGQYPCRLLLTDAHGRTYEEIKSFIIDSRPPTLRARLSADTARAGDELTVTVDADRDTRRIMVRLYGAQPVPALWDAQAKASIARLRIPSDLPSGNYTMTILAEDFAHNNSSLTLELDIIGGAP